VPEPIATGALRAGKLVQVLEPFASTVPGMFLYYPSRRQTMPKLRAFIDHVKSRSDNANKAETRPGGKRTRPRTKS
jgi:DNA-binding transcriptional LysR family regulator